MGVRMGGGSGGSGGAPSGAAGGALAGTYPNPTLATATSDGFVKSTGGGREVINTIASSGSAVTLDLSLGNVQDVTLTAATVTVTLTGQVASKACSMTVFVRQDATGGRLVTWPAAVAWPSGNVPLLTTTASGVDVINLVTLDGGTTWLGFHGTTTAYESDPGLAIDAAVETEDRLAHISSTNVPAISSGAVHLSYFRARKTVTITKLATLIGSVAAAATPTVARMGLYSVATNGDLTAVCETDNIATAGCTEVTSSWVTNTNVRFGANAFAEYAAPLSGAHLGLPTSFTVHAGSMYAWAPIVVSAAAVPSFYGNNTGSPAWARSPRISGLITGQADIPATITAASVGKTTNHVYGYGLA